MYGISLLLLVSSVFICPGQDIVLSRTDSFYTLSHPYFLITAPDRPIDAVIADSGNFRHSGSPELIVPATNGVGWIYMDLQNRSETDKWFLEIPYSLLHKVDLYEEGKGIVKQLQAVSEDSFLTWPVKLNIVVLPLDLLPGQTKRFYLQASGYSNLRIPVRIGTMETLYQEGHRKNILNGFLCGLLIAMMLYNLFVYFSLKDPAYLYYVFYMFFTSLLQLTWNGYIPDFFPGSSFNLPVLMFAPAIILSVLFTNAFLQTKVYIPVIYRGQKWMIAFFSIPLLLLLPGYKVYAFIVFESQMYVAFVYWMYTGIVCLRKGFKPAAYYLVAFGALVVCGAVFNLKDNGLVPDNYFSFMVLQTGPCIEAIILSFALALKLNILKKEKEHTREMAVKQASAFSKKLIDMQETERNRVASELHDSTGQKLILLKNKLLSLKMKQETGPGNISGSIISDITDALQEIRDISYSLRPYQVDMLGFSASVRSLAEEIANTLDINFNLEIENIDPLLTKDSEMNLYRVIQELLNNMVKHAGASSVDITIRQEDKHIFISIRDNGIGFLPAHAQKGLGLTNIKERISILKGSIEIESVPLKGTITKILLPVYAYN